MPLVLQVPGHLANPIERRVEELPVDQPHQAEVLIRLSNRLVVERRARDRQQAALRPDRQRRVVPFDHSTPYFPVHGLSFRDKKIL